MEPCNNTTNYILELNKIFKDHRPLAVFKLSSKPRFSLIFYPEAILFIKQYFMAVCFEYRRQISENIKTKLVI